MAITRFGPRSVKGRSRFRGNPKSAPQIKTCLERSRRRGISPYNAPVSHLQKPKRLLIQGAVVDYSSHIFHP